MLQLHPRVQSDLLTSANSCFWAIQTEGKKKKTPKSPLFIIGLQFFALKCLFHHSVVFVYVHIHLLLS